MYAMRITAIETVSSAEITYEWLKMPFEKEKITTATIHKKYREKKQKKYEEEMLIKIDERKENKI